MKERLALFGALAVAIVLATGSAQAKLVRYEINGQQYSYSTNNRQQSKEARQRIEAAKAVDTAKAKADAELAANPLVKIFGSAAQREAAEAKTSEGARAREARPQDQQTEVESTSSLRGKRAERSRGRHDAKAETARESKRASREAARTQRRQLAEVRKVKAAAQKAKAEARKATRVAAREVKIGRARAEVLDSAPIAGKARGAEEALNRSAQPASVDASAAQASPEPVSSLRPSTTQSIGLATPTLRPNPPAQSNSGVSQSAQNSLTDFVNQVRKSVP